jgi:hypothetical protein
MDMYVEQGGEGSDLLPLLSCAAFAEASCGLCVICRCRHITVRRGNGLEVRSNCCPRARTPPTTVWLSQRRPSAGLVLRDSGGC